MYLNTVVLLQVNSEGFSGWLWSAKSPISHAMTGVIALQNFFGGAVDLLSPEVKWPNALALNRDRRHPTAPSAPSTSLRRSSGLFRMVSFPYDNVILKDHSRDNARLQFRKRRIGPDASPLI